MKYVLNALNEFKRYIVISYLELDMFNKTQERIIYNFSVVALTPLKLNTVKT